ncbi:ABC transporter substrate-binding protein [Spirulina sp. 06S082]|uniref:ABC transporter substrate-binding protein n=1 Tax=Spirulina sp. 06S082 TaxID=3110248 RepID=UPI002B1FFD80|nr:ABC transporter substrate-binding protein [Spirulina sp. 06S082]MEA5469619.1 ABC transporter substrate-binding protein [Spirulina sp. 06S082]
MQQRFLRLTSLGRFFSLFFLCFFLVVGCNTTTPNSQENPTSTTTARGDRVTLGTTDKPRTLDPADSYEIAGSAIIYNVCQTLYAYEPGTTDLKPLLATEMPEVSEDGLTYTISLRDDVTFHDSTPFNAEAMKFSLDRFIKNGGKPSFLLADIVEAIEAPDETTLIIKLKKPFAAFPALLGFSGTCAVSPEAYEIGEGKFNPNELIGSGPYTLTEFNSDTIRLDVFKQYWGNKPKNKGVDIQIYNDNSANLFNAVRTQAVDIASQSLDPDQIANLLEDTKEDKLQVIEAPGTAVSFISLNRNQQPLDKLEVRQAIASIVNRKLINERVLQGQADELYSLIPTSFDVYEPIFEKVYGDANVEKAKELLEKAGYSADNPAIVPIWFPASSNSRTLAAQTLQAFVDQELEGVLKIEPETVDGATFFKNVKEGIYPATMVFWYPDFLDADNYVQPFLSCEKGSVEGGCSEGGSQTQGSFYYSDRVNELIDAQRQETDAVKRKAIFKELQEILAEDVPYIPLWQNKEFLFVQNGVDGVQMDASQNIPFWEISKG